MHLHFFAKNNKNNLYNVYVSAILRKCNFNVIKKNGKKVKNCLKYNHGSQFKRIELHTKIRKEIL